MAKLLAYTINGQACGRDISSWEETELNDNAPFVVSDTVLSGYTDISSIENWDSFGLNLDKDWKFVREEIKTLGQSIGWENTTLAEKKILCKYFASGIGAEFNNGETIWTDEEQREFLFEFRANLKISRTNRDLAAGKFMMEMVFRGYAPQSSMEDMINEIRILRGLFLTDGQEGTQWGDTYLGLFDYLCNTSSFEPCDILAVNTSGKTFTVEGDISTLSFDGMDMSYMRVRNSTGNDGRYTIVSKTLDSGNTIIEVAEVIPSEVVDGTVYHSGFMRRSCASEESLAAIVDIYINGNY